MFHGIVKCPSYASFVTYYEKNDKRNFCFCPHFSRAELKDLRYFLCNQHERRCVGERFADVNIVDRVAHVGDGVMVWYGQAYGQQTQVHFINGILNAQRNRDEILRNIVVPFIHDHHLMLQHDNARPHVVRIYTQFLEAENITVLAWPAYSCHPLSMFGMLWIGVYDSVFQFLAISSNFTQPLKRSGPTFHRPQSTTWSTLCEGDVLHCVRHMVATPDTKWFSDPPDPPIQ